jgi:hypothetical protein
MISSLFVQPRTPAEWAALELAPEQIEFLCDSHCAELDAIFDPAHSRGEFWYGGAPAAADRQVQHREKPI